MLLDYFLSLFCRRPIRTVPRHVAFIMDGNGRWAERQGQSRVEGHRFAVSKLDQILQHCFETHGISHVTLYAFSAQNWSRPKDEVDCILNLIADKLEAIIDDHKKHKRNVRVRHLGRKDRLPERVLQKLDEAENLTQNGTQQLILAIDYSGREEIVDAVNAYMKKSTSPLTTDSLRAYMPCPDVPDPDLVIRTSGEARLSEFMNWQISYSEFCFVPQHWPDFGVQQLDDCLRNFASRQRRFGNVYASKVATNTHTA